MNAELIALRWAQFLGVLAVLAVLVSLVVAPLQGNWTPDVGVGIGLLIMAPFIYAWTKDDD